jgi:hypothetical protein
MHAGMVELAPAAVYKVGIVGKWHVLWIHTCHTSTDLGRIVEEGPGNGTAATVYQKLPEGQPSSAVVQVISERTKSHACGGVQLHQNSTHLPCLELSQGVL